jgi:hypothetical protein
MRPGLVLAGVGLLAVPAALSGQNGQRQTSAGEYTRYELLGPATAKFHILYEVWATTPGARYYFNPIRKGSVASGEAVFDKATGAPLKFSEVDGPTAQSSGLANADTGSHYIRVELPRPVPPGGVSRILIEKTYYDPKSYYTSGDTLIFNRSLGIKRNAVVLPPGYELLSCNFPSQVLSESDGRIFVSFINPGPDAAPLVVKARPAPILTQFAIQLPDTLQRRLGERATQTREIVYYLQQPETHAFDLYHDYTESRIGVDKYLNVVRAGSTVSNTSAIDLDTGAKLPTQTLKGDAITQAKLDIGESVMAQSEVVVIPFPAVTAGHSIRLRISETYTDAERYRSYGNVLVWDRSFGRPVNAVVLPAGWILSHSSIPATVSTLEDGRVRLDFVNPRPDEIQVLIVARRR